jgi:hypothetical protein
MTGRSHLFATRETGRILMIDQCFCSLGLQPVATQPLRRAGSARQSANALGHPEEKQEREVMPRYADREAARPSLWPFHFSCDISLSSQSVNAMISGRVSAPAGLTSQ